MRGFQWGYWHYPGGHWLYPPDRVRLSSFPFNSYLEGSCASYKALDQRLFEDEDLRENVIASIYDDPQIPRSDKENIKVEVKERVVHLQGQVRYRQSKFQAFADAYSTPGVNDVKNTIELK